MTESPEIPLSDKDKADLASLGNLGDGEEYPMKTLLEIWRELLTNIEAGRAEKVTPQAANHVVTQWPKISFQEVPRYHEIYHDLLIELRQILLDMIKANPDALKNLGDRGAETSDAIANRPLYLELLFLWQFHIMGWEAAWDASDPESHLLIAAIADATSFFVSNRGLVEHLTNIGFVYSDDDRDALGERLSEARAEL